MWTWCLLRLQTRVRQTSTPDDARLHHHQHHQSLSRLHWEEKPTANDSHPRRLRHSIISRIWCDSLPVIIMLTALTNDSSCLILDLNSIRPLPPVFFHGKLQRALLWTSSFRGSRSGSSLTRVPASADPLHSPSVIGRYLHRIDILSDHRRKWPCNLSYLAVVTLPLDQPIYLPIDRLPDRRVCHSRGARTHTEYQPTFAILSRSHKDCPRHCFWSCRCCLRPCDPLRHG